MSCKRNACLRWILLALLRCSHAVAVVTYESSGKGLAAAFANPAVDIVVLTGDVVMRDTDWDGLGTPVYRQRNLTIRGKASTPDAWPLLDMGYVAHKVQLGNFTALSFQALVIRNFRRGNPNRATGLELLLPANNAMVLATDVLIVYRVCYPAEFTSQPLARAPRPALFPGTQLFQLSVPQTGCVSGSLAPQTRCWPRKGIYNDLGVYGADVVVGSDGKAQQAPNGIVLHFTSCALACEEVLSDSCIKALGPWQCYDAWINGTWHEPIANSTPAAGSPPPPNESWINGTWHEPNSTSGAGSSRPAIRHAGYMPGAVIGGVIGGFGFVVCATAVTAAVAVIVKRRRRRQQCCLPKDTSDNGMQKSRANGVGNLACQKQQPAVLALTLAPLTAEGATAIAAAASGKQFDNGGAVERVDSARVAPGPAEGPPADASGACDTAASSGSGSATLVSTTAEAALEDPHMAVTPLTALRPEVQMAEGISDEVTLLPRVLGRGSFGKVVEGVYRGQRVAVKMLVDMSLGAWGLPHAAMMAPPPPPAAPRQVPAALLLPSPETAVESVKRSAGSWTAAVAAAGVAAGASLSSKIAMDEVEEILKAAVLYRSSSSGVVWQQVARRAADAAAGPAAAGADEPPAAAVAAAAAAAAGPAAPRNASGESCNVLLQTIVQEVEVLGRCQHPNVVRLLAACLTPPRVCLVMELMQTSLQDLLWGKNASGGLLPMSMVLDIALDVARGLDYLHPTVVHRDLKPGNVLLNLSESPTTGGSTVVAKLSDFGLSRLRLTTLMTTSPEAGTPGYIAPELYEPDNFTVSHRADIYSYGVLLWVMLTGQPPWKDLGVIAIAYRITIGNARLPLEAIPEGRNPPRLMQLIKECWDGDPLRRPAAGEIVKLLLLVSSDIKQQTPPPPPTTTTTPPLLPSP